MLKARLISTFHVQFVAINNGVSTYFNTSLDFPLRIYIRLTSKLCFRFLQNRHRKFRYLKIFGSLKRQLNLNCTLRIFEKGHFIYIAQRRLRIYINTTPPSNWIISKGPFQKEVRISFSNNNQLFLNHLVWVNTTT